MKSLRPKKDPGNNGEREIKEMGPI
jgi:hypothetical protein